MDLRNGLDLVLLAAIWGSSFLFMRIAVPEMGPAPLVMIRVGIAAIILLPLLLFREGWAALRSHWPRLLVIGAIVSAVPFVLYAYAATQLTAGFGSILSATTPLWGALVATLWLRDRLSGPVIAGLGLGFAGVVLLVLGKTSIPHGDEARAIAACLLASLSYGIGANFTKRYVAGISPLAIAAGSQTAATLILAPVAFLSWPDAVPSRTAWFTVLVLGVMCTAIAYILYFRLIRNVGPARAMSVTYLVPAFGVLWGALFLGEAITPAMVAGTLVILAGVGLTTGGLAPGRAAVVTVPVRAVGAGARR